MFPHPNTRHFMQDNDPKHTSHDTTRVTRHEPNPKFMAQTKRIHTQGSHAKKQAKNGTRGFFQGYHNIKWHPLFLQKYTLGQPHSYLFQPKRALALQWDVLHNALDEASLLPFCSNVVYQSLVGQQFHSPHNIFKTVMKVSTCPIQPPVFVLLVYQLIYRSTVYPTISSLFLTIVARDMQIPQQAKQLATEQLQSHHHLALFLLSFAGDSLGGSPEPGFWLYNEILN